MRSVLQYLKNKVLPVYCPTQLGGAVVNSMLENPDDWNVERLTAIHLPSGIEVWTGNSVGNRRFYRVPGLESEDVEKLNTRLSAGDRYAIEQVIIMLRQRCPEIVESETDIVSPVLALLTKNTRPGDQR